MALALLGDNRECFVYRYENLDILWGGVVKSILYMCEGSVCFQSKGNCTPWHGSWTVRDDNQIEILFCCRGSAVLKSTLLFTTRERNIFEGFDYAERRVRLTLIDRLRWSRRTNGWEWQWELV